MNGKDQDAWESLYMDESQLGFCKGCGEYGEFHDNLCDKCFDESEQAKRYFEAEKQYRWDRD